MCRIGYRDVPWFLLFHLWLVSVLMFVRFSFFSEGFFVCVCFMSYSSVCYSLWVRHCGLGRAVHHIEFMEPRFSDRGDEASIRSV